MMIPLAMAALDTPFSLFEISPEGVTPPSIRVQASPIRHNARLQSILSGNDVSLTLTKADNVKIGAAKYFVTNEASLYPINVSTGVKHSFDDYISTINDITARISTGRPHPRSEALSELANRALISQSKETRSIAQWAKDLANDSFNN